MQSSIFREVRVPVEKHRLSLYLDKNDIKFTRRLTLNTNDIHMSFNADTSDIYMSFNLRHQ